MRSKLKTITKYGQLLGAIALMGSLTVSCANKNKTASAGSNPYSSNPYYTGDSSSSAASSAGSSEYPSYDDSASYTPPAPIPAASPPQTYPSYTGGDANPYPSYSGGSSTPAPAANPYPSYDSGYTGSASGNTHTVAKGENLYRISLRYGTTISAIQNANGLGNTTIFPGQVLQIP
ncbi:MAG: LysM peptidoglycan-binding domain-containing protein [Verrucomicrobiales bacterium]|nr:LysM peptidoglycan-binding domain-containing protein [Verrucomicrobiales bacterium]